jgi:hypothetical protein
MATKLTDLPIVTSSAITDAFVFPVGLTTETDQLSLNELQKSFTGLTARTTNGISVIGKSTPSGITVADNGYVGVDNFSPSVALDIGDVGTNGNGQVRVTASSTARKIHYTLQDSAVVWRQTKRASDTDYYLEVSQDGGSTVTGVINVDVSGNVGLFNGGAALTDKLFVSGGSVHFKQSESGIKFLPSTAEIQSSATSDILYFNKTNNNDISIGNDVFYVDNDVSTPKVGINNATPEYTVDASGNGRILNLRNRGTASTDIAIGNNTNTGFIGVLSNNLNIGPTETNSVNNLVYKLDTKKFGVGSTSPDNKLHVYSSSEDRIAKFETDYSNLTEVFQVNNYASGPTKTIYSFARGDSSGPTLNVRKWGVGLYDDGATNTFQDVYAFFLDGDTSSESNIKAYLDRNGNWDIDGGITTSGQYTQGKLVQSYKSVVNATSIYFDPLTLNHSPAYDNHTASSSPFSVMPYAGRIEKIQIYCSNPQVDINALTVPRIEIAAITPSSPGNDNATSFVASPVTTPTPGSAGIIGYKTLSLTQNAVSTITRSQFVGSTTFSEGQLLQYRICQEDGSVTACNFVVMSVISFTVT